MCGVFSITAPASRLDRADLQGGNASDKMHTLLDSGIRTLHHRGPDGYGLWVSDKADTGLAHARLSIIDLTTGQQPISNETNDIHIIVNGEFYGYEAIMASLKTKGHAFKTSSDSEIALHLYEEYDLDFVEHLRGEFALILYDERQKRLVALRDRFGVKPLVYSFDNDVLMIASEAKAILSTPFIQAQWDEEAYYHATHLQYLPADRTLFKGIYQLQPGQMLIHQDGALSIKTYWDMDYPRADGAGETSPLAGMGFDDMKDKLHDLLQDSVACRLRSDVPICMHLSGGIDSASIAGLSASLSDTPIDCFTVSFNQDKGASSNDNNGYDEYPIALEQAQKIGAKLHRVCVDTDQYFEAIGPAVYKSEGLAINGHLSGKYYLNEAIRKAGFTVTLSGEGSDEIFAGYPHLREDILLEGLSGNKGGAGDDNDQFIAAMERLYKDNNKLAGLFLSDGETLDTSAIHDKLGYTPSFLRAKASLGYRLHALLRPEWAAKMKAENNKQVTAPPYTQNQNSASCSPLSLAAGASATTVTGAASSHHAQATAALPSSAPHSPFAQLAEFFDVSEQLQGRAHVDQSSYLWTKLTLAGYILKTLGDGCEMAHSIEGRVPFLDHKLFEFVRHIPLAYKIKFQGDGSLTEKYILREAMKPYLTDTLYKRQKHPFIAPPTKTQENSPLYAHIMTLLSSDAMRKQPFFDPILTLNWFKSLQKQDAKTQVTAEPILMTIITTLAIQDAFNPS